MLRARVRGLATAARGPPVGPTARHKRKKNLFATVGLPLVLFVVGGFVGLTQVGQKLVQCAVPAECVDRRPDDGRGCRRQFMGGKYEARDHAIKSQSTRAFDLDEEHKVRLQLARTGLQCAGTKVGANGQRGEQRMTQKLLLDDFELKPVPKPKE